MLAPMRIALALLVVAGCVTSDRVPLPDGSFGWYIECPRDQSACLDEAAEKCPRGYEVIDRGSRTGAYASTSPYTMQTVMVPVTRGTLTIECKRNE